jgi:hypothetical protein
VLGAAIDIAHADDGDVDVEGAIAVDADDHARKGPGAERRFDCETTKAISSVRGSQCLTCNAGNSHA